MGTALQHDAAARFAGIRAAGITGQDRRPTPGFTPGNALTYDAKTPSTSGTGFTAVHWEKSRRNCPDRHALR